MSCIVKFQIWMLKPMSYFLKTLRIFTLPQCLCLYEAMYCRFHLYGYKVRCPIVETFWKIVCSMIRCSPGVHIHHPVLGYTLHPCSCYCLLKCTCIHVPVKCCVISLKQCMPVECLYKFNKVVKFEQFCVVSRNMFSVCFILGV